MIDAPPPVGPDLTHGWGPYLLTLAVAGVGAVWGTMRSKDAKLVGSLEAQIVEKKNQYETLLASKEAITASLGKKLDDQRDEFRAEREALQAELDEERRARIEDARRTASLLLRGHVNRGRSDRPTEWDEAPTGVRELLELVVPGLSSTDPRRDPSLPPPPAKRLPPRSPR